MTQKFLLDTNIVIYLSKDIHYAELYQENLLDAECVISFMTAAELFEGAVRAGWTTPSAGKILDIIEQYVVIPCNIEICEIFGRIRAGRKNRPVSVPDALIAATGLAYGLPLVTHNRVDFDGISGLEVISEYDKK